MRRSGQRSAGSAQFTAAGGACADAGPASTAAATATAARQMGAMRIGGKVPAPGFGHSSIPVDRSLDLWPRTRRVRGVDCPAGRWAHRSRTHWRTKPWIRPPHRLPATQAAPGNLRANALGLPSVLFCIVTGAAPLAAMIFNVPVAVLGGGYGEPAAFLIATIALTIFSVGYIEMSRRVTSTGGFYAFITRGLGSIMGLGVGVFIALCYLIFTCAVLGTMSYFAATSIETWTGIDLPAYVYMAIGLAMMTSLAFFHIELTAKILGVALVCEVLALLML